MVGERAFPTCQDQLSQQSLAAVGAAGGHRSRLPGPPDGFHDPARPQFSRSVHSVPAGIGGCGAIALGSGSRSREPIASLREDAGHTVSRSPRRGAGLRLLLLHYWNFCFIVPPLWVFLLIGPFVFAAAGLAAWHNVRLWAFQGTEYEEMLKEAQRERAENERLKQMRRPISSREGPPL
jgi:hypothetical protein